VTLDFWRNLSTVWLAFLCMIGMVIPLAVSVFAVKGMHVLVDRTPALLGKARGVSRRVRSVTEEGSRRVAEPVVVAGRATTRITTIANRLRGVRSSRQEGSQT
jgi:hypothetical protein